jgi:hypothetical protein
MLIEYRRSWHAKVNLRKFRRLVSKDARRLVYPNRRSPYVPCLLRVKTIWK